MPDRQLAVPAFPDDDGRCDPALALALEAYDATPAPRTLAACLHALQTARLVVPVVAVLGETEQVESGPGAGLTAEKSSDMAAVLVERPDGRRGLLAFSSTDTLAAWDPAARPVPVTARTAALAAVQARASAMVVDVAGPSRLVVGGEHLRALAAGWRLVRAEGGLAWAAPAGGPGRRPG